LEFGLWRATTAVEMGRAGRKGLEGCNVLKGIWFGFESVFAFEKAKSNDPAFSQFLLEKLFFYSSILNAPWEVLLPTFS
jgi:hypothetical protein